MNGALLVDHDDIKVGDYLIIVNPYRSRFGVIVDKIGEGRRYVYGRVFSVTTFESKGLIAFNGDRTKIASLRPTTTVRRVEVQS
jgi:hypothetical protein